QLVERLFGRVIDILGIGLCRRCENAGVLGNQLGVEQFIDLLEYLFARVASFRGIVRQGVVLFSQFSVLIVVDDRTQEVIVRVLPAHVFALHLDRLAQVIESLILIALNLDQPEAEKLIAVGQQGVFHRNYQVI